MEFKPTTVRVRGARQQTLKDLSIPQTGGEMEVFVYGQLVAVARVELEPRLARKIAVLHNTLHTGQKDAPDNKAIEQVVAGAVVAMQAARVSEVY